MSAYKQNSPDHNIGDGKNSGSPLHTTSTAGSSITVSDALALVATWSDLSMIRRGALCSALRTITRIAEADPAVLILSPAVLNAQVLGTAS